MEQPPGTINGTQAYIIECNRANSDIDATAPPDQNAKWTTKTDFQLKRGDRVSVEAIMIESIGASNAAQTIEFDGELIKDGRDFKSYVDNKIVFEFGFYLNNNGQRSIQLPIAMPCNFMNKIMDANTTTQRDTISSNNQGIHRPNTLPVNTGGWILESNVAGGGWAKDDLLPNPPIGTPFNILNDAASTGNMILSAIQPNQAYNGGGYGEQMFPGGGRGFGGGHPIDDFANRGQGQARRERTNYYCVYGFIINGLGGGRGGDANKYYFLTGTGNNGLYTDAQILDQTICSNLTALGAREADQVVGVILANTRIDCMNQDSVPALVGSATIPDNYQGLCCDFNKPVPPLVAGANTSNATVNNGNYYGQGRATAGGGNSIAGNGDHIGGLEGANCELVPGMCLCIGACYRTVESNGGTYVPPIPHNDAAAPDYTHETEFPLAWENFGQIKDIVHLTDRNPYPTQLPQGYLSQTGGTDPQVSRLLITLREPHKVQRQPWDSYNDGINIFYPASTMGGYCPRLTPNVPGTNYGGGERTFAMGIPKYGSSTCSRINGTTQDPIILRDVPALYNTQLPIGEIWNGCQLVNSTNPLGSDILAKGRLGMGITNGGAYPFRSNLIEYFDFGTPGDRFWWCPSFHRRLGGALLWEATRCWTDLCYLYNPHGDYNGGATAGNTVGGYNDSPEWGVATFTNIVGAAAANHGGIYCPYNTAGQNTTGTGTLTAAARLAMSGDNGEPAKMRTTNLKNYKDNLPYIFVRPTYTGCQVQANGAELAPKMEAMTAFVVVEATESFEDVNELAAKFVEAFHSVNELVAPTGEDIKEQQRTLGGEKNNCVPYYSTGFFPPSVGWNLLQGGAWTDGLMPCQGYTPAAAACWNKIAPSFQGNLVKCVPANMMIGIDWARQENSPYFYFPNDQVDYLHTGGADLHNNQVWMDGAGLIQPVIVPLEITNGSTIENAAAAPIVSGNQFEKKYEDQLEILPPSNRGILWNNQIYGNLAYKDFRKAWAGDRFNRLDCCRMNYSAKLNPCYKPLAQIVANQNGQRDQDNGSANSSGLPRIANDISRPVIVNNQLKKKIVESVSGWANIAGAPPAAVTGVGSEMTHKFRGTVLRKNDVIMTNIYWTEENLDALQEIFRHNEKYNERSVVDDYGAEKSVDGYDKQNKQPTNWYYEFDIGMADDSEISMSLVNGRQGGNPEVVALPPPFVKPPNPATGFLLKTIQPKWSNSYFQQTSAAGNQVIVDATTTKLPGTLGQNQARKGKAYGCPYTAIPYGLAVQGQTATHNGIDGLNYGTGLCVYVGTLNCPDQAQFYGQEPIDYTLGWEGTVLVPKSNEYGIDSNTFTSICPSQSCIGMGWETDYTNAPPTGIIRMCSRWNELWEKRPPHLNLGQPKTSYKDQPQPYDDEWFCGEPVPNNPNFPQFNNNCVPAGVIWNGEENEASDWADATPNLPMGMGYGTHPDGNTALNNVKPVNAMCPNLKELLIMAKERNLGVVPYYYCGLDNDGATCVVQAEQPNAVDRVGDERPTDFPDGYNAADTDTWDNTNPTSNKSMYYGRDTNEARDSDNRPVMIGFVTHRAYTPVQDDITSWELGDIHYGDFFGWSNSFLDNPAIIPMNADRIANPQELSLTNATTPETIQFNQTDFKSYCWNNINYIWMGANNANMIFNNEKQRFELSQLYTEQFLSNFNAPLPDASGNIGSDLPDAGAAVMIMNTELNDAYFHQVDATNATHSVTGTQISAVVPPIWQEAELSGVADDGNSGFSTGNRGVQDAQSGVYLKDIWLPPKNWSPPENVNLQNYYDPSILLEPNPNPPPQTAPLAYGHGSDEPNIWVDKTQQNYDLIISQLTKASDANWSGCLLDKMGFDYRQLIPYYGEQYNRFKDATYGSTKARTLRDGTKPLILNSNADTAINPAINILGAMPLKYGDGDTPPSSLNWQLGTPLYSLGFLNNDEVNVANVVSGVITANRMATLFACPFYIVLSDIAPTQFQSGSFKQECMFYGLKNYGAGQYFYVFGANYSQLVDTDRTITQIKTEIRNPLTGHLAKLSPNSCILYKIERNIALPPIDVNVDGVWVGEEPPPKDEAFLPSLTGGGGAGGGHLERAGTGEARDRTYESGGKGTSSFMPSHPEHTADTFAMRVGERMAIEDGVLSRAGIRASAQREMRLAETDPDGYRTGGGGVLGSRLMTDGHTEREHAELVRRREIAHRIIAQGDKERQRLIEHGDEEAKSKLSQLLDRERDKAREDRNRISTNKELKRLETHTTAGEEERERYLRSRPMGRGKEEYQRGRTRSKSRERASGYYKIEPGETAYQASKPVKLTRSRSLGAKRYDGKIHQLELDKAHAERLDAHMRASGGGNTSTRTLTEERTGRTRERRNLFDKKKKKKKKYRKRNETMNLTTGELKPRKGILKKSKPARKLLQGDKKTGKYVPPAKRSGGGGDTSKKDDTNN